MINILDVMNILVGVMSILVLALFVGWMHASRKDIERVKTIRLLRERVYRLEWGMARALRAPQEDFRKVLQLHWDRYTSDNDVEDITDLTEHDQNILRSVENSFSPETVAGLRDLLQKYNRTVKARSNNGRPE
jgi:hypothetical protein